MVEKTQEKKDPLKFSKDQILSSKKYDNKKDLVSALWSDNSLKSFDEINMMIENYLKCEVK